MNRGKVRWIGVVWAWAMMVSGVAPLSAQEITEPWVADQLGGSRSTERPALSEEAERSLPTLSLVIRYVPATGELTPASASALRPLYTALQGLAPIAFRVVCCTGLPKDGEPTLARQLIGHMSRLFADRQSHVQFQVQAPAFAVLPQVYPVNTARIDIYRLP